MSPPVPDRPERPIRPDHGRPRSTAPRQGPLPTGRPRQGGTRPGRRERAAGAPVVAGPVPTPDPARDVALAALRAVADQDAYANLLLPGLLRRAHLTGRDAAFTTGLVYGTLRARGTLDAVLTACVDRPLTELDPAALDVLRLGAHQLLVLGTPAHAGVSTSVDLARRAVGPGVSRLVNAVLRRVSAQPLPAWVERVAPAESVDPVGRLAVQAWHPAWVVGAFRDALGGSWQETAAALAADNTAPLVTLAARPGRITGAELLAEATDAGTPAEAGPASDGPATGSAAHTTQMPLDGDPDEESPDPDEAVLPEDHDPQLPPVGDGAAGPGPIAPAARPGRWSPLAVVLSGGDPARLSAVRSGRAGVQDEGSQLVPLALAAVPTTGADTGWWLDACAGPGGKAALLAGLAEQVGARLLAGELQPHRARLVDGSLRAATGATAIVADATAAPWAPGTFDRVLLDAPCSGLGSLRRRPEARWRRTPADLATLRVTQRALLGAALRAVRPGGVVAYATCSPHLVETSVVVGDALRDADRAGTPLRVERLHTPDWLPGGLDLPVDRDDAQLWPHRHGTDAMYLALLRRTA